MNRNDCDIARDLMPLSVDGVCSGGSQRFLDAHVAQCPPCRDTFAQMKAGMPSLQPEPDQEAAALKKGLRYLGRRFKALWITVAALVCAFVLLLAAGGVQQMLWYWSADVPLDMSTATISSTSALVSVSATVPFRAQYFNGQSFELETATDADNHTGQPEAVILTYTLHYFPHQLKQHLGTHTTPLAGYRLCHDNGNIYLIDGKEGVILPDGDQLLLLDPGLPVSEIRIKSGKDSKVIYSWGDTFEIKTEDLTESGYPVSKIMLRKDYEAMQNAQ